MKSIFKPTLFVVCFWVLGLHAQQTLPINDANLVQNFRNHVRYLASDELEGRLVGSKGEKLAYKYIEKQLKTLGVAPLGVKGSYLQPFTFNRIAYNSKSTYVSYIKRFNPGSAKMIHMPNYTQFYPIPSSGFGKVTAPVVYVGYGITTQDGSYDDYKYAGDVTGKIVVITLGWPERKSDSTKYAAYGDIQAKIDLATKRGAGAIILINDDSTNYLPKYKPYQTAAAAKQVNKIPVVLFPQPQSLEELSLFTVTISVDTITRTITGHNVVGFIDNKAAKTVVIGAHYDHLGYNELGGSTYRNNQVEYPRIHNGADDNASGTAALIELSGLLRKAAFTNNNYILVAFSGEEEGLLGSNYFCKNSPVDTATLNYMINMDMIGRLDTLRNTFAISGTGTSPTWNTVLQSIPTLGIKAKYSESGTGASDHTSFYNIGVPALHYFTGTHYSYHKPTDDEWRINYQGMLFIVKHIYELIGKLDSEQALAFKPTPEDTASKMQFKVTLGIMPDYLYEGKGLKIDGVTPGKSAHLAGIIRGDVLVQLGNTQVDDINAYMKALSTFNKGQTVGAVVIRAGSIVKLSVTF